MSRGGDRIPLLTDRELARIGGAFAQVIVLLLISVLACESAAFGSPVSAATRSRLARGEPAWLIVEFDGAAADRFAWSERVRRRLMHDDPAILGVRKQGYDAVKIAVEGAVTGADATRYLDYSHFPLAVWRVSSLAALDRLQSHPSVRKVHDNEQLRVVSVSDLPFINQPQTDRSPGVLRAARAPIRAPPTRSRAFPRAPAI